MKKVVIVLGPTAVGKTKMGIMLAKKLQTEIISGDSVQVYRGLNIGSAKVKESEMDGIKHHLIDILEPTESYSVATFQKDARKLMDKMEVPLIVGGTGLYIKAALANYEFSPKERDDKFADNLSDVSNEILYERLLALDPLSCKTIHPNNRKRVLRALEMASENAKKSDFNHKDEMLYDAYIIYLNAPRNILYERINKRVDLMFEEGLEAEVRALYEKGIYPHAIGYQEFIPYFQNEVTLESVKEEIKKNSRHLAKRQITWFKNQMQTHFYEVNFDNFMETFNSVYRDVCHFLEVGE